MTYVLRRAHLYAGLMMLPWVFLYGVTGLLFNHPTWFADRTILSFGPDDVAGGPLSELPSGRRLAEGVVSELGPRDGTTYRLVRREEARYDLAGWTATVAAGGKTYSVTFDPTSDAGKIRELAPAAGKTPVGKEAATRPRGAGEAGPDLVSAGGIELGRGPLGRFRDGLPVLFERLGLGPAAVETAKAAPLTFFAEGRGRVWAMTFDPPAGTVTGRPADASPPTELSTRKFLLRMHLTHGYPADGSRAKFLWAVVVDAMGCVMIFWGVSGVVMWWQIKRTRRLGAAVLLASAAAAAGLVPLMHAMIAAAA